MNNRSHLTNESGATAIEMAIVTASTWFVLVAIFDFSRYLVAMTLITFGAHEAVILARSAIDLDRCVYDTATSAVKCAPEVTASIDAIAEQAREFVTSTFLSETEGAPQELTAVNVHVPGVAGSNHPDTTCRDLSSPSFTMANLMKRCPIVIDLEAEIWFMTPGLGRRTFAVELSVYREPAMNFEQAFPESEFFPL